MPAIEVLHLQKNYGDIIAVDLLSFEVPRGKTYALLGGNGAGKTTTLSMLLGLLLPTSGTIRILGIDMIRDRFKALPRMNFTSPYVDIPHRLTVEENLRVYGGLYGVRHVKRRISDLAEEYQLTPFLKRRYGSLSQGQKTRVSLAKSLLNEPEVLLMDEPTAALDPYTADQVRTALKAYQARTEATILLASHNMREVERLCDNILMMKQGRIVDQGSPVELIGRYGEQNLEDVFIQIAKGSELPR